VRIGIDITAFAEGHSGIQLYIRSILDNLQDIDKHGEYFLFERFPSDYKIINPKWQKVTIKLPKFFGSQTLWFQFIFPYFVRKNKIEIVWSPAFFVPRFISKKIRVLLTIYDLGFIRVPETFDKAHLRRCRLLIPNSLKRADLIMVISDFISKEIRQYFPAIARKRIIIAACGRWQKTLPENYSAQTRSEFLFFAGNFEPRKNLLNVIKALEYLAEAGLRIELQIAGPEGWRNRDIKEYLSRSPINKQVTFLGFIDEHRLIENYCKCKALIFPSLYEGFGMPVLEALSLDCLVLTSKNTVMEEICGQTALYFDPRNPVDIAKTIRTIFQAEFDRKIYLSHRMDVLNRYDWKNTTEIIYGEITAMNSEIRPFSRE